jgi:CubicO group peptidase (beta-lactamase class C family)
MVEVHGECKPEFEGVRRRFVANFDKHDEVGASVCVTVEGETVVDLWGGYRDAAQTQPWERDTIVNVYSTTKTMSFLVTLMLVDRGLLDLDSPVARYWPEFAASGKEDVRVEHLFTHSAGLPGWDEKLTVEDLYDWDKVVGLLAAQAPWWEPGSASGYHALTQGYLLGELCRRTDGRTLGTFFRQEIAEPLGADFHIGLRPEDDDRVAELVQRGRGVSSATGADKSSIPYRVFSNPLLTGKEPAAEGWRRAEIPAAGGIGNARSVARIHAAVACGGEADGVRLLSPETVELIFPERLYGQDHVMGGPVRFGLGYGLPSKEVPISPSTRAAYWGGWGGSIVLADADTRMSVGYVMNRMENTTTGDARGGSLVLAAYRALQAG